MTANHTGMRGAWVSAPTFPPLPTVYFLDDSLDFLAWVSNGTESPPRSNRPLPDVVKGFFVRPKFSDGTGKVSIQRPFTTTKIFLPGRTKPHAGRVSFLGLRNLSQGRGVGGGQQSGQQHSHYHSHSHMNIAPLFEMDAQYFFRHFLNFTNL